MRHLTATRNNYRMSILESMLRRHSISNVTEIAPLHEELLPLIEAAGTVADHGGLRPWRFIELRGEARDRLAFAFAEAQNTPDNAKKFLAKVRRAPLLIAIVAVRKPSEKVPVWEQDAVAAGVAHALSLLLDEAGWGVMWRTGIHTRTEPVRQAHQLHSNEELLGWLYIGGKDTQDRKIRPCPIDSADSLSVL